MQKQERSGCAGAALFVVDVAAPPEVVFGALIGFEEYPGMIPVVRQAERRAPADASVRRDLGAVRMDYKISRFWLDVPVVHLVDSAASLVRFDLDLDEAGAGALMQEASGVWRVEEAPGSTASGGAGAGVGVGRRSRVTLRVSLNASPWLPLWLIDYAAERALRRGTAWLKPHMERLWAAQHDKAS